MEALWEMRRQSPERRGERYNVTRVIYDTRKDKRQDRAPRSHRHNSKSKEKGHELVSSKEIKQGKTGKLGEPERDIHVQNKSTQ
jgi:hypothetical protein